MPRNGETNAKFGVYKTLCCGQEIILRAGVPFPDCPNHPGLTTIWKATVDDNIVRLGKPWVSECVMPRFHVGDPVIFVGPGAHRRKQGSVVAVIEGSLDHVHRYQVRLSDGTQVRCFAFELQPILNESSAKSA
jgi:hypothetical protein